MTNRIRAKVSHSRQINMFGELSHANLVLLENALQKRDGYLYELMACLIVAAFKHEALVNYLGFKVFPDWTDKERLPNASKLEFLAIRIGVSIDKSRRPFQTLSDLFKARDQLAHGKPQLIEPGSCIQKGTREELRRRKPLTKWETMCTVEFAQQAYDDTEAIAELLWQSAGFKPVELRARLHSYTIEELRR